MDTNGTSVLEIWLSNLCRMLPEVQRAIIIDDCATAGDQVPEVSWPDSTFDPCDLYTAAKLASSRQSPVFNFRKQGDQTLDRSEILVAYPLNINDKIFGTVSLSMFGSPKQQDVILQLLDWGLSWLQLVLLQKDSKLDLQQPEIGVLQACVHSSEIRTSAYAVVTEIARMAQCQRVSLGLLQGNEIKLMGISNTPDFDVRASLAHSITKVMTETLEKGVPVFYDRVQSEEASDISAHWQLAQAQGVDHINSIPIIAVTQVIGVLVLERNLTAFSAAEPAIDQSLVDLLARLFALKQQVEMGLFEKCKRKLDSVAGQYLGAGSIRLKLLTIGVLAAVSFIMLVPGEFRVSSTAVLEGRVQQAIVAPFDGYVEKAFARAGDLVQKNDVIAELDDRELRLEQMRWLSQKDEFTKQYRNALADLDHSAARISQSQIAQADAQLELVANRLERVKLVSPLDGIIISGDLSRLLGIPLERGQLLFEIAPLDEYRLVLGVDEQDIVYVQQGQTGTLTLAAFPRREIPFTVQKVAVLHQQVDAAITFRTEASIESDVIDLRPGMQGVGKISIDERNYLWIWTRSAFDWLRLKMWAWLP